MDRPERHEQRVERLIDDFKRVCVGLPPKGIAEAPGRLNLIGEHVDYNDGLVLPFAIDRNVMCAWFAMDELVWLIYSGDRDQEVAIQTFTEAADAPEPRDGTWADYARGVVYEIVHRRIRDTGQRTFGGQLAISGNVPQGAGLSSSAALEVAVGGAIRAAWDLPIDDVTLAKLCQRAENEYVGVQCGIMDQFASALSKKDHALLIDCRTLAYEHIPLRLDEAGLAIVAVNSGVKRELASSAYNLRRRECEEAVAVLRERLRRTELTSLRDVTQAEMDTVEIDGVSMRRARHVVSEIGRVAACVEALRAGDFVSVGRMMVESHQSLRDDFEVSCEELDLLVGLATAREYVLGARLTGAGFGGCTVNLLQAEAVEAFERDVVDVYRDRTGLPAEAYLVMPQDGLRTWRL